MEVIKTIHLLVNTIDKLVLMEQLILMFHTYLHICYNIYFHISSYHYLKHSQFYEITFDFSDLFIYFSFVYCIHIFIYHLTMNYRGYYIVYIRIFLKKKCTM